MPTLDEEIGFYRGKIYEHDGQKYRGECVPTAVANYFHLQEISEDTIENVLHEIMESPEYDKVSGRVFTSDVPAVVERALRTHIDKNIHVTLYGNFPDDSTTDKNRVKYMPGGTNITTPIIVFTDFKESQHFWVAAGDPVKRIDNDGKVHKELDTIEGHLEIKHADAK